MNFIVIMRDGKRFSVEAEIIYEAVEEALKVAAGRPIATVYPAIPEVKQ